MFAGIPGNGYHIIGAFDGLQLDLRLFGIDDDLELWLKIGSPWPARLLTSLVDEADAEPVDAIAGSDVLEELIGWLGSHFPSSSSCLDRQRHRA